jgi:hypothetical protein
MKTKIICAFPGCGKSFYHKNHSETTLDSDSSMFSWVIHPDGIKERNPEFPHNYIEHIKNAIGKYDVIFISTHKEVRDALVKNCIFHYIVYPRFCDKEMFKQRYIERHSDDILIQKILENWTEWIKDLSISGVGYKTTEWNFAKSNMEEYINFLDEINE